MLSTAEDGELRKYENVIFRILGCVKLSFKIISTRINLIKQIIMNSLVVGVGCSTCVGKADNNSIAVVRG